MQIKLTTGNTKFIPVLAGASEAPNANPTAVALSLSDELFPPKLKAGAFVLSSLPMWLTVGALKLKGATAFVLLSPTSVTLV